MDTILEAFAKHGRMASFHYADDTTSEWASGDKEKSEAMKLYLDNPNLQDEMKIISNDFLWSLERELKRRLSNYIS